MIGMPRTLLIYHFKPAFRLIPSVLNVRPKGALSVYPELIRVPFLIYHPGSEGSKLITVNEPVSTVDLVPTRADILGFELEHPVDRVSLTPAMKGGEVSREVPILAQITPGTEIPLARFCVVEGGTGFLQSFGDPSRPSIKPVACTAYPAGRELYDLQRDPNEIHNLVDVDRPLGQAMEELLRVARDSACSLHVSIPSLREETLPNDLERQLRALGYLD
jgi:arylsulfatase A-like enzyme